MILGEKKTFETKSARQFSRFVPSFNPVCLSVMTALPYGSEPSSRLCFVKDRSCENCNFFETLAANFRVGRELIQCVMLADVTHREMHFPGRSEYSQRHEKKIATGTEHRGRHLFLAENSSTSCSI